MEGVVKSVLPAFPYASPKTLALAFQTNSNSIIKQQRQARIGFSDRTVWLMN